MHDLDMYPKRPGEFDRLRSRFQHLVRLVANMRKIGGVMTLQDWSEGVHFGGLGSLLVADDTGGTIWRISYKGPPAEHAAGPAESTGSEAKKSPR